MKNWEKVNEVWDEIPGGDEGTDHWRQICHAFNVDPDAEYVEPAKPQPEAEYDAGWVEEFYDALLERDTEWEQDREDLCKEAARREREKWEKKQERLTQLADILTAVGCAARGQSHAYDWHEPAPELTNVLDLRAERDRMAAELDRTKAAILISNQRATNAIERARVLGDRIGVLEAERDELLWRNANQKRLLEQYQARLRERQPSADLAELVRLAESVDTIVNERRYIDPLFVDQSRLILRLAQAVAGMGGGR